MKQLFNELKQEELENIYGGKLVLVLREGRWIEIEVGTKKS